MGGFRTIQDVQGIYDSKGVELALNSLTQATLQNSGAGLLNEIGVMAAFGGAVPPTGWLICDGSAVSRTIFAALYAVIGTNFGIGDGSTTFNLPKKGVTFFGLDTTQTEFDTLGKSGGQKVVQSHSHVQRVGNGSGGGILMTPQVYYNAATVFDTSGSTQTAGSGANNLNPYQVANWIIRYAAPTSDNSDNAVVINWIPTVTGFSSVSTNTCFYSKIGRLVTISVDIGGTSNATSMTATLPIACHIPAGTYVGCTIWTVSDNGVPQTLPARAYVGTANTLLLNIDKTIAGGAWTAAGLKQVRFNLSYLAA